ncbi:MAG: aspartate kinase [Gaiellales bacterium]
MSDRDTAGKRAAATVVMKFGGTSVGDPDRIRQVARRLVETRAAGTRVVGVVSAMGKTTDDLIRLAGEVSNRPDPRELDMLLSVGERISCALVAMAINDLGTEAVSLTGSQAGIITDEIHGKAKIREVRARRIDAALDGARIVLVAGFQGMSEGRDITTLGRGGSDTTAVALAASLRAEACEIYTDVDGVFSADPRLVPDARKLAAVSYEEMLELAAAGAKVLQLRSVEFARNHGVTLHVRSTFTDEPGTWVVEESDRRMEKAIISGVTYTTEETVYRVHGAQPAELFSALADGHVNVDTIIQTSADVIVFSAPAGDRPVTAGTLDRLGASWSEYDELGKVSVVGAGMKSHPGIAARTFQTLRGLAIEPQFISTSPIKIAFYVPVGEVEHVVQALHDELGLATQPE